MIDAVLVLCSYALWFEDVYICLRVGSDDNLNDDICLVLVGNAVVENENIFENAGA